MKEETIVIPTIFTIKGECGCDGRLWYVDSHVRVSLPRLLSQTNTRQRVDPPALFPASSTR